MLADANRIEVQISGEFQEIGVFLDKNGLIPALIQMTLPMVAAVVIYGISRIESLHQVLQIRLQGLEEQMIMIGHQHIAVQLCMITVKTVGEDFKKFPAVTIILKDVFPFISPAGYMIPGTGVFYADRSGHARTISAIRIMSTVNS